MEKLFLLRVLYFGLRVADGCLMNRSWSFVHYEKWEVESLGYIPLYVFLLWVSIREINM